MMAKPMKTLELHYPMIQSLIIHLIIWIYVALWETNPVLGWITRARLPDLPREQNFPKHIIDLLLTKLVRARWLDIGLDLFLFCEFVVLNSILVHKHANKELGQQSWTSTLSITCTYLCSINSIVNTWLVSATFLWTAWGRKAFQGSGEQCWKRFPGHPFPLPWDVLHSQSPRFVVGGVPDFLCL